MYIKSIKTYQFRNLIDQETTFSPKINFIQGRNGQGKTNLIEAISFLSDGCSFRTSKTQEAVGWDKKEAAVFARVVRENLADEKKENGSENKIGVTFEEKKKKAFLNDEPIRSFSDFIGNLVTINFSPKDLSLVKDAPTERRKFLDKHLVCVKPKIFFELMQYQKALKNKQALLKTGNASAKELDVWDLCLAQLGHSITTAREGFLQEASKSSKEIYKNFSREEGELDLFLKSSFINDGVVLSAEEILEKHRKIRQKEVLYKSTFLGAHHDDIDILLGGKSARAFASQGQARSVVLAMKLGVIEIYERTFDEAPVVLLDDVDAELDNQRRHHFFDMILNGHRQVFITGTDIALKEIDIKDGEIFNIEQGALVLVDAKSDKVVGL